MYAFLPLYSFLIARILYYVCSFDFRRHVRCRWWPITRSIASINSSRCEKFTRNFRVCIKVVIEPARHVQGCCKDRNVNFDFCLSPSPPPLLSAVIRVGRRFELSYLLSYLSFLTAIESSTYEEYFCRVPPPLSAAVPGPIERRGERG